MDKFIVVETDKGAWLMFILAFFTVAQCFIIIAVFYDVPKRVYGQFASGKASFIGVGQDRSSFLLGNTTKNAEA